MSPAVLHSGSRKSEWTVLGTQTLHLMALTSVSRVLTYTGDATMAGGNTAIWKGVLFLLTTVLSGLRRDNANITRAMH